MATRGMLTTQGSLVHIVDSMVRRGASLRDLFPELAPLQDEITQARKTRKALAVSAHSSKKKRQLSEIDEQLLGLRRKLRTTMLEVVRQDVREVSALLSNPQRLWGMDPIQLPSGRTVYKCKRADRAAVIAREVVAQEFREIASRRAPNRHSMASSVRAVFLDGTPKVVVRADIEGFFEAIDHGRVRDLLETHAKISSQGYRNLLAMLDAYETASGTIGRGVPAGLAVGGLLAEIALTDVDHKIAARTDVSLYLRFVDDLLVVFPHWDAGPEVAKREAIVREAIKAEGLSLNESKTYSHLLEQGAKAQVIEYLGYAFKTDGATCQVELSEKRVAKCVSRLERSFAAYASAGKDARSARALKDRVEMLTSNYRLVSPRGNVLAGVHFGSPLVPSDGHSIARMDSELSRLVKKHVLDPGLLAELSVLTFESGIRERRFMRAGWRRLGHLAQIWRGN